DWRIEASAFRSGRTWTTKRLRAFAGPSHGFTLLPGTSSPPSPHDLGASSMAPKDSQVLVVGGAGYIGSALLPRLLERGYSVRIIDLLLFGREPIATVLDHPRLEIVEADFRREDSVRDALAGVDTVIHLGGLVGDPACALDERLTVEINLLATER